MDLFFYDFEFNLRHIARNYISTEWIVKYNGVGTFEAHFAVTSDVVPLLMEDDIVEAEGKTLRQKRYIAVRQGAHTAIITGKSLGEDFTVYGRTANWILTRRTVPKFKQQTQDVQTLVKWFAGGFPTSSQYSQNLQNCGFHDLFQDGTFIFGTDITPGSAIKFWRNTQNPLEKVVSECLARIGAGHRVEFDPENKKWVLQLLQGRELPLIISESNKNAYASQIDEDCLEYYTCGWYEEQPEAEEGSGSAPESVWKFIPGDTAKTGIYRWECVLSGTSLSDARSELEKKTWSSSIQAKAHGLALGEDYQLGDIVRVQVSKGKYKTTVKKRITGVTLRFAQEGDAQQPEFSDVEDLEKLREEEESNQ